KHEGGEAPTAVAGTNGNGHAAAHDPGERKPRRERARGDTPATASEPAPAAAAHKKPGFFHRIARFFGGR
ncbi:MAG: ATP-dependent RNA helicase RhlB, partial [Xanthomonadales bacterium]|nr:ATP-dependent RNA helicase RhlB [Xanthomonadales bacterium]